jgi:hypothetical protein
MKVKIDSGGLRQARWYEYLVRFIFGGTVTALAGIVAKQFGPAIGGLFLAFPAIFPATATLIDKHEKQKKQEEEKTGTERGRAAAGVEAAGAAMGSIGLVVFATIVWNWLPDSPRSLVLTGATLAWLMTSILLWKLRETLWRRIRAGRQAAPPGPSWTSERRRASTDRRPDE